jgi:hypothetical protein
MTIKLNSISLKKKSPLAIALALILTLSMIGAMIPKASAAGSTYSWGYCAVVPKDPQVNTLILITGWTSPIPGSGSGAALAPGVAFVDGFKSNYTVTLTKPNGAIVTIDPLKNAPLGKSYQDGSFFATYFPDTVGTWTATMTWAGDKNYAACTSEPFTFVVGTTPGLQPAPDVPIPSYYWTRPVPGDIRNIGTNGVLSSWTHTGSDAGNSYYNEFGTGPQSPHVLWTYPIWAGGVMGGNFGDLSLADAYTNGRNTGTPIINGIAYVTINGVTHAVSMTTGKDLWSKAFTGTVYYDYLPSVPVDYDRGMQTMIFNVLPGKVETWAAYDGGLYVAGTWSGGTITDSRVGITALHGNDEGGAAYYVSGGYLLKWWTNVVATDLNATDVWWTTKIPMNKTAYRVPIPTNAAGPSLFWQDIGISSNAQTGWNLTDGTIMWNKPNQIDTIAGVQIPRGASNDGYHEGSSCVGDGKFFYQCSVLRRTVAIDLYTGNVAWVSEPRTNPYGAFSSYQMGTGDGLVFTCAYDGVWACDTATGATKWHFSSGNTGETPYGTWSFWSGCAIVKGMVYVTNGEHSATNPQHKGNHLYCLNNKDGSIVWELQGAFAGKSVADDKLLVYCENTGELFCIGRGPTETTVDTSSKIVNMGSNVLVTGTVTDASPGSYLPSRPHDTPCVSQASMQAQMEYIYLLRPQPMSTGVPVQIWVTTPGGSPANVGTTTTDAFGNYAYEYKPTTTGIYTLFATFQGDSENYWPSTAGTKFAVDPAPSASPSYTLAPSTTPTAAPSSTPVGPTPSSDLVIVAAAAVIVIIVVAAAAVLLRRRK